MYSANYNVNLRLRWVACIVILSESAHCLDLPVRFYLRVESRLLSILTCCVRILAQVTCFETGSRALARPERNGNFAVRVGSSLPLSPPSSLSSLLASPAGRRSDLLLPSSPRRGYALATLPILSSHAALPYLDKAAGCRFWGSERTSV